MYKNMRMLLLYVLRNAPSVSLNEPSRCALKRMFLECVYMIVSIVRLNERMTICKRTINHARTLKWEIWTCKVVYCMYPKVIALISYICCAFCHFEIVLVVVLEYILLRYPIYNINWQIYVVLPLAYSISFIVWM